MRLLLLFALAILGLQSAEESVECILINRIDTAKKAVGMVVGTIDAKGSAVVGYGKLAADRPRKPDGDTIFEIGSISKVFTSLLLADMIERGEVNADDPIKKFLPESVKVPSRNGREITLLPGLPAEVLFSDIELQTLHAYSKKTA